MFPVCFPSFPILRPFHSSNTFVSTPIHSVRRLLCTLEAMHLAQSVIITAARRTRSPPYHPWVRRVLVVMEPPRRFLSNIKPIHCSFCARKVLNVRMGCEIGFVCMIGAIELLHQGLWFLFSLFHLWLHFVNCFFYRAENAIFNSFCIFICVISWLVSTS